METVHSIFDEGGTVRVIAVHQIVPIALVANVWACSRSPDIDATSDDMGSVADSALSQQELAAKTEIWDPVPAVVTPRRTGAAVI